MRSSTEKYASSYNNSSKEKLAQAGNTILHDLHELRDDAQILRNDVKKGARTVGEVARHTSSDIRDMVGTIVNAPGTVLTKVRANPLQAFLIALGVGLIAGRLYRH